MKVFLVLLPSSFFLPSAFFVVFFDRRERTRRRAERFAIVEQGQIAHVQRQRAARALFVDDHGDGAAFHAFAEADAAAAGEARVGEPFQHRVAIILHPGTAGPRAADQRSALISRSNSSFVAGPMCFLHTAPLRPMTYDVGRPQSGPCASSSAGTSRPTSTG